MQTAKSSGSKSATALICTGPGKLSGLIVATDATNAQTFNIYDGLTTAGTKLTPEMVITTSATDRVRSMEFNPPLEFYTGLYVSVSGAGTVGYSAFYKPD